jgi:exosome complex RNA-binding protein Rrp4
MQTMKLQQIKDLKYKVPITINGWVWIDTEASNPDEAQENVKRIMSNNINIIVENCNDSKSKVENDTYFKKQCIYKPKLI